MAAIPRMPRSPSRTNSVVQFALVVASLLAVGPSARAHHSVPVNFDQSKEITITGALTEAKWINPHSRFRVNVKQDDGTTVEWLVEMGAVNTMRRGGFHNQKFVVGDTLTNIGCAGADRN